MSWTCPGCGAIYLEPECATCHMRGGEPWLHPVVIKHDGVEYLVKRQNMGATTVVTTAGRSVPVARRAGVLRAFLAQQHP